jgi:hypothetical protein
VAHCDRINERGSNIKKNIFGVAAGKYGCVTGYAYTDAKSRGLRKGCMKIYPIQKIYSWSESVILQY